MPGETDYSASVSELVERLAQSQDINASEVARSLINLVERGLVSPSVGTPDLMIGELNAYIARRAA